jgi:hypothetical protein
MEMAGKTLLRCAGSIDFQWKYGWKSSVNFQLKYGWKNSLRYAGSINFQLKYGWREWYVESRRSQREGTNDTVNMDENIYIFLYPSSNSQSKNRSPTGSSFFLLILRFR